MPFYYLITNFDLIHIFPVEHIPFAINKNIMYQCIFFTCKFNHVPIHPYSKTKLWGYLSTLDNRNILSYIKQIECTDLLSSKFPVKRILY